MSLRCRSCNTAFHDNGSLEVHYQYAHSNGDSLQEMPHRGDLMYDVPSQQNYENFMMNTAEHEYTRSSPGVSSRQMPIQQPPPLHRYEKCEYQCMQPELMLHHYNVAHNAMPSIGMQIFSHRFGNLPILPPVNGGTEPQAEILDLDSHKVHVYQPPNGEDSQDSDHRSIDPWAQQDDKKFYQQQLQVNQNGASNGRGGISLPSPDFSNVSTTTDNIENLQSSTRSPYYEQSSSVNSKTQITSSDNPTGRSSSKSGKNSNGTWKSNEARRPKTYNCSACNKWFTSSGHLKRHYNTTLHKNAVKQSGAPDPASLPVSVHHHPQKDPSYTSSRQVKNSPPIVEPSETPLSSRNSQPPIPPSPQQSNSFFLNNSPNLMAGPSEVPRGLLHPSQDQIKSPSPITSLPQHSNHTNYLPFGPTQSHTLPFFQQHTPTTLYPNFKSPHVSTTQQITTNNHSGNLTNVLNDCSESKLPSFSCIQKPTWNSGLDQFLSTLDSSTEGNVGGSFTSKEEESNTELIFKNLQNDKPLDTIVKCDPEMFLKCESDQFIKCEPVQFVKCEPLYSDSENSCEITEKLSPQTTNRQAQLPLEDTDVTSSTERTSPVIHNGKNGFSCEKCQKFFNKACYLTQHNKSFHSGLKPFKCSRCGKRFQDSSQYNVHLAKHGGNKPYKCEICPKAFNHKTDLRRHACLHTNVRPYNCDICSKGFIRKDHMLKHRDTHQNRKSVIRSNIKFMSK